MTMLGRWDRWWEEHPGDALGGEAAYARAERWLNGLSVEDWGCGAGAFRLWHPAGYVGVDGSGTPDVRADLTRYRSKVPGIFMRGVLEHNPASYLDIMRNLCQSLTERAAVVLFTPMVEQMAVIIGYDDDPGVPIASLPLWTLLQEAGDAGVRVIGVERFDSPGTVYGAETILYLEQ